MIDAVLLPAASDQANAVQTRRMIETAIHQGAPLYNAGHVSACAKVYMTTMQELLSNSDCIGCEATRHTMQTALTAAQHTSCSDSQAWMLRRALDVAYTSLNAVQ